MASQNIARLGVVFALNTAEFTASVDKAISEQKRLQSSIERDSKAAQKLSLQMQHEMEDYGKTVSRVTQLERMLAEGRMKNASPEIIARLKEQAKALDQLAESRKREAAERMKAMSGLTPQQQAQIGYQMTDVFTSLTSGQNPLMVLIQQGGQLRDTFGGVGNAIRAVVETIGPLRLAFAGVAAVIGTFAYAAYRGAEDMARLRDELILSGNIAGKTSGYFLEFGRTLANEFNISIGNSREIMASLASSGKFTEVSMDGVARAIGKYAQLAGVTGKEASEKLIPLLDGTAASARQMNSQFNFLTFSQYRQIEALERYGRVQEAIKLQSEALTAALNKQERNLGTLEKAWQAVKNGASSAWDAMLGIGRDDPAKRVEELAARIAKLRYETDPANAKFFPFQETRRRELETLQEELRFIRRAEQIKADVKAAEAKKQQEENEKIAASAATGGDMGRIQRAAELEKATMQAQFAVRSQMMTEQQRIDLEYANRIGQMLIDMRVKNEQEGGRLVAHNQAMFNQQLIVQAQERNKKTLELEMRLARERIAARQSFRDLETRDAEQIRKEFIDEQVRLSETSRASQLAFEQRKIDFAMQQDMLQFRIQNNIATEKEIALKQVQIETERALAQERLKTIYRGADGQQLLAAEEQRIRAAGSMREALVELEFQQRRVAQMSDAIFGNMTRAIENFVRTGKLSFKELARSIIADLIMIQMRTQLTTVFRSVVGNIFGGGFGSGFRFGNQDLGMNFADGGQPPVGRASIVGERGPELFVPHTAGTIIPNHALGGLGGVTNVTNNYIQAIDVQSFEQRLLGSSNTIWAANQYAQKSLATGRGRT